MNTGRLATTGLLLLALALPLAAADSFSVRVKPVSADIFPFEVATYNLTIFNNNPQNASFFQLSGRGGAGSSSTSRSWRPSKSSLAIRRISSFP